MDEPVNSWGSVLKEFDAEVQRAKEESQRSGKPSVINFDSLVEAKISSLIDLTQRSLVIYAVDFFNSQKVAVAGIDAQILPSDKDGFVEVTRDLPSGPLDVILHSPGGSLEATEAIVSILRHKFNHVRFIVPNIAKSAATMLALSGDEIILASSAELGPIDPQFNFPRGDGAIIPSPAQAIIDQFEGAEQELSKNPSKLPAWIPILPMYGPSLYQDCKNALKLSKEVVRSWLTKYMYKDLPKKSRVNRARKVVNYFANHKHFKSHGRKIGIAEIEKHLGNLLKLRKLDDDVVLYNRVMGLYFALLHLFQRTSSLKILWNNLGKKFVRHVQVRVVQIPGQSPIQPAPQSSPLQLSQGPS
ncbi:MAG: serine protease [Bacteroidota bacterium]